MSTSKPKKRAPKKAEISESENTDYDGPSKTQRQSSFTVHHHAL
jgi:hypothetical protein